MVLRNIYHDGSQELWEATEVAIEGRRVFARVLDGEEWKRRVVGNEGWDQVKEAYVDGDLIYRHEEDEDAATN